MLPVTNCRTFCGERPIAAAQRALAMPRGQAHCRLHHKIRQEKEKYVVEGFAVPQEGGALFTYGMLLLRRGFLLQRGPVLYMPGGDDLWL